MSAFTPTETQIERIFSAMQPEPGQRFYRRMTNAPWQKIRNQNLRLRYAFAVILPVVLFGAFLVATPQGRALAQQILGFFRTTTLKYLPPPTPTNTPVPTYALSAGMVIVQSTPAVNTTLCGSTVSPISSTFPCQLINAEAEVGFAIKTFPADRIHLTFKVLVVVPELPQAVAIHFTDGPAFYTLSEGIGDFPSDAYWNPGVPENAVQQVQVAGHPAEFVAGGWNVTTWDPDYPAYWLRWKEDNRWFDIQIWNSDEENPKTGVKEEIIGLAENLVTPSQGVEGLAGADTPTVSQRAGFKIVEPKILPDIFQLCSADYVEWTETMLPRYVDIHYCWLETATTVKSLGSLDIVEAPVSEPGELRWVFNTMYTGYAESNSSEDVQVGGSVGQYISNEKGQALIWTTGDLKFMVANFWTPSEGGRLGKAYLFAIAESMK